MPLPVAEWIRREQGVSAVINAVLSAVFFALVFGFSNRTITMGMPDGFARDFLVQGVMVSLMGGLVPALIIRARLRRQAAGDMNLQPPQALHIARAVLTTVSIGVASGLVLSLMAWFSPWESVATYPALLFKVAYGAGLGLLCTKRTLHVLFLRGREQ